VSVKWRGEAQLKVWNCSKMAESMAVSASPGVASTESEMALPVVMALILGSLLIVIYTLVEFQVKKPLSSKDAKSVGCWLPPNDNAAKRQFEIWALGYTVVWIALVGVVIVTQAFEWFDADHYLMFGVTLASPFLLQPILFPMPAERNLPLHLRYSFKANVWIAIFTFIGNYWYTHYFYSVLQAVYSFPCHRVNHVPINLFFMTHFYFVTYHTFSNIILRKIETTFRQSLVRSLLFWVTVFAFSYFTAFMETLTISAFPYYHFPPALKRDIYIKGSAFYGIYFIVSYPVFYRIDEKVDPSATATNHPDRQAHPHTLFQTVMEAFGTSMIVMCLLDFCRLGLGIPLTIPGVAYAVTEKGWGM
jgi:cycloeucalenol cycloisomerase